jgi:hypothetical protein
MTPTLYTIVGMGHAAAVEFVRALPHGEQLDLRREPGNPFDGNAISIYARGRRVGYVRREQNQALAAMLDRGDKLVATLHRKTPERWPHVSVQSENLSNESKKEGGLK